MMQTNAQDNTVNLVDPTGKVGSLPMDQANEALDNGYRQASFDETNQAKNEDKFGGVQGAVFSGALGAARTATLGGSDWALTHLPEGVGFSPEELKGFSETNPISNTLGEVGGILNDPFSLGKMITGAGKATSAGAESAIKAITKSQDASMAVKTLTGAMGHAVEGGLYGGVLNSIDDSALGDAPLNGEKVLANVGYGSLLGGSFGGLSKVLGFGITPAIRKAVDGLADLRNDLIGSGYGDDALVQKVLPKRFADAITDRQLNLDTNGQASVLKNIVSNLNSVTNNVQDEVKGFSSDLKPDVMSSLFTSHSKIASDALSTASGLLYNAIDKLKSLAPENTQMALENLKSKGDFSSVLGGSSEAVFDALKKVKSYISEFSEKEPDLGEALNPIKETIDKTLKDPSVFGAAGAAKAIHEDNVSELQKFLSPDPKSQTEFQKLFGETEDGKWQFDLHKLNDVLSEKDPILKNRNLNLLSDFYSTLKDMPDNLLNARRSIPNSIWKKETLSQIIENSEKTNKEAFNDYTEGIKKRRPLYGWKDYAPALIAKWHPVLAAAIEAYDFYQDPVHATHGLSFVERMLGKTTKTSLDLMDQIFNPSVVSKVKSLESIDKITGGSSSNDKDDLDNIKKYSANPEMFSDAMEKSTKDLTGIAPNISQHLNVATGNALSFLASKMPQSNEHMNPLEPSPEPSATEMAKFERYRSVVKNPLLALEQIRDKTIGPETIETLSTVYPKLYEQLKQDLIERTFTQKAKGKSIPYQTKQAISMFIGQSLDSSLDPQSIMNNQQVFMNQAQAQAQKNNKSGSSRSSFKDLGQSSRISLRQGDEGPNI